MKVNAHKQAFFQSIHVHFFLALRDNKSTTVHADIFSVHSHAFFSCTMWKQHQVRTHRYFFSLFTKFFSYTTWASGNLALLCIHWHFAVKHISFFETPTCAVILQLLNRLRAFVSRGVRCFLHVLKSVVVILLTCQLEKCLERGNLWISSCLFCTNGLKKSLYNLPHQLFLKDLFPLHN